MANRKVLINRHTTGNTAPNAAEMFHGEIAVAHKTGEETLFTKNNANEMVPFISCAQTISIIDSKISGATVSYDVKSGEDEAFIAVATAKTGSAVTFTVTSDGIMSEDAFEAYSAATKTRIDTNYSAITDLTAVVSALTDVVVTGITGDSIITATLVDVATGENAYNITHKQALATDGFNKLATDAYGHVTASTAVAASDIKALGFEDSAWTEEKIASAITALDSSISASSAGKYFTALAIENGKLVAKEEADIPVLSVESAGTGNVVASISVDGHKISYTTTSVATSDDIEELSAATEALSAGTVHDLAELSGATEAISGYAHDEIAQLSGATEAISGFAATQIAALSAGTLQLSADTDAAIAALSGNAESKINELSAGTVYQFNSAFTAIITLSADTDAAIKALDSETAVTAGKYLTGIAIADGKISGITEADLPTLEVESAGTGNVVSQITVSGHKISYSAVSVATSEDIQALSASVIALSAETVAEFSSAFTAISNLSADTDAAIAQLSAGTIQLSADTKAAIDALSGNTHGEIAALSAGTIQLSADTKAAIEALSAGTIAISGYAHGEIVELSGAVQANETDIDNLSAATLDLSAVTITGVSLNNTPLTVTDHAVSIPVTVSGSGIANATDSGSVADAKAVKEYVENLISSAVEYKGATGATPASATKGDLYIASADFTLPGGEKVETGDFIIYDGTKWDVIEKNLDGAITGNLTQDTVTLGDSTNSVKSLANGSAGQVLTIGTAGTPVWADDPVLSTATTGNGNVVSEITVNDHEITYVKNFTAATNADLEIVSGIVDTFSAATVAEFNSAFTAINTLSADAHNSMIARDDAVFASAKTYADEQIDEVYASAVSYADSAITYAIEGLDSVGSASTTGHYLTSVTITDGKISAVGEAAVPAAVAITATTGAAVDTPSAVLTGVTADGTDNHNLTFGMSNKVFSASSSDSALTSESALTAVSATVAADAVHASAATKVDNALTVSGYSTSSASSLDSAIAFDGSEAKSLTFGTVGNAGLNSMSMTSAGLVDVEVIDCGEY